MPDRERVLVTKPGFYELPEDWYHQDPAPKPSISSGVASILLEGTLAEAKQAHPRLNPPPPADEEGDDEDDNPKGYDMGNVAHRLVLGQGPELVILDYQNWRKKAAREARKEAFAQGKQPVLVPMYEKGLAMAEALRAHLEWDSDNGDAFDPSAGQSEIAMFWKKDVHGRKMWVRNMADRLMNDRRRIYDYKTWAGQHGADPDAFIEAMVRAGRDIQDPCYSEGLATLEGVGWDEVTFRWIVQEPEPPYLVSVIELIHDPEMENSPRRWSYDRWQWAIERWYKAGASGEFPGYLPRTYYCGVPSWSQARWLNRKAAIDAEDQYRQLAAPAQKQLEGPANG